MSEKQRVYTCLRVCTWLACVIGVKSISPVVAWKTLSKLQHIYFKNDLAALHGMLLILLMTLLSSRMCLGDETDHRKMHLCHLLTQKDMSVFSGDCNYRLRNQERLAPLVGISTITPVNRQLIFESYYLLFLNIL